jgi:hypothetical protein
VRLKERTKFLLENASPSWMRSIQISQNPSSAPVMLPLNMRRLTMSSKTTAYGDMVCRFKERFPHVADYMVFNPSKNMVMDEEENLLVHYFCKLDYAEGVKYILEKSAWGGFEPKRNLLPKRRGHLSLVPPNGN